MALYGLEVVDLFAALLCVDTANPPGSEPHERISVEGVTLQALCCQRLTRDLRA